MDTVNRGPAGSDVALLIGRVLMATIFIPSGYGKLMGLMQFAGNLTNMGVPADYAYWVAVAAGGVEFFGAICILLGLATRYVAILLAVFTLIAALLAHRYWTFTDAAQIRAQSTNFYKNLAIVGGFLILYAAGGGRWSIDRRGA
ncbi:MAG TPA: DoxX family protein [Xanthobacteraceae bacterium]